jgi:dolichol-phosphate mannosyltransferase
MDLTILIPSYDEALNLKVILPRLKTCVSGLTRDYEVLVLDSQAGCKSTQYLCEINEIKYIRREGGDSYGAAIRTGLRESGGKYILIMDADGSHDIASISVMWKARNMGQIVVASRYIEGGRTDNPKQLIYLSRLVNTIFRVTLGINCRDVSNSFRLYPGEILRTMKLASNNFDIIQEILIIASFMHAMKILEIPTRFKRREYGLSKRNLLVFAISYGITLTKLVALKLIMRRRK